MKDKDQTWFKDQLDDAAGMPLGHRERFEARLQKLQTERPVQQKGKVYRLKNYFLSAAAVVLILLAAGGYALTQTKSPVERVAPQMAQTESYFNNLIENELKKMNSYRGAEAQIIITEATSRLDAMEKDYDQIISDLEESEGNPNVISALINNLQNRIDLLRDTQKQLNEIKKLKEQDDEII